MPASGLLFYVVIASIAKHSPLTTPRPKINVSITSKYSQPFSLPVVNFAATMIRKFIPAFLFLLLLTACEKTVVFKLDQTEPKLVVEATIENGQEPVVYLTKSLNYFSSIDRSQLVGSFVHGAEIFVSNGAKTQQLREYSAPIGGGNFFYYYSSDAGIPSNYFRGELDRGYSLQILVDGKEYRALTRIPDTTRRIDSLFWKPAPAGNPTGKVALMVRAYDRPGFGDYIRYFTKRNSEPFYPGLNSVYDDQIIDGSSYEVQVERGVDRNYSQTSGYSFFDRGDTVTLKLCNIDKNTFDFWRTMEFTYASVGNPFASPTRVLGNISGGALGYFGGYAAQYRTIIIPQ